LSIQFLSAQIAGLVIAVLLNVLSPEVQIYEDSGRAVIGIGV
jgi:hypothetical protein